jgi:hypothetical protein
MNEQTTKLQIAIYRGEPSTRQNVSGVGVGPLLDGLTEEPYYFANVGEEGKIQIEIQRAHEWELIIHLVLAGSGIFITGALTELGKRFGGCLADRATVAHSTPEVRAQGQSTIPVNRDTPQTASDIAQLLQNAVTSGASISLVIQPATST